MKVYTTLLQLFCFLFWFACTTPLDHLQLGAYDKAFDGYAQRVAHAHKYAGKKDLKGLEVSFHKANETDLRLADSLRQKGLQKDFPRINQAHREVQRRQQKIQGLLPIQSRKGFTPHFQFVSNIDSLEAKSRLEAADILYQQAMQLLDLARTTQQRPPARQAYNVLKDLTDNYFPQWDNAAALLDTAKSLGTTHILLQVHDGTPTAYQQSFLEYADLDPEHLNTFWQCFHEQRLPEIKMHYRLNCSDMLIDPGVPNFSTSSRTETKEIEVGTEEKKDSSGHVIERKPIYETVSATITEERIERNSYASVRIELYDDQQNIFVYQTTLTAQYTASDQVTKVSGDTRALSSVVFSGIGSPTAPAHWVMIQGVAQNMHGNLRALLKKQAL